jgi:hypothetical protein
LIEKALQKVFRPDGVDHNENVALTKPVIEWEINTVNKRLNCTLVTERTNQSQKQFQNNLPRSMLLRGQVMETPFKA